MVPPAAGTETLESIGRPTLQQAKRGGAVSGKMLGKGLAEVGWRPAGLSRPQGEAAAAWHGPVEQVAGRGLPPAGSRQGPELAATGQGLAGAAQRRGLVVPALREEQRGRGEAPVADMVLLPEARR